MAGDGHIISLELGDFRNFVVGTRVEFGPRFTVLWGHNGAGKTNVLEALYLISTLRSFRSAGLDALLRRDCDHARVELEADDPEAGLVSRLEIRIDRHARSVRRSARVDGKLVRSASEFYGRVSAILFTPEDLGVLRGSPTGRRQFLDRMLFARDKAHIGDVQRYDKLLRSRNRVLKSEPGELAPAQRAGLLDSYDAGLAEVGARIGGRRQALIDDLRQPFVAAFAQIHDRSSGEDLQAEVDYRCRLGLGSGLTLEARRVSLAAALREHRRRDEAAGRTTVGPHLDDLRVTLDGAEAGAFASQGQARALVLAFKIAELRGARARTGRAPLLLLDDVSSELDPARSARLFETLAAEVGQCVLTTTSAAYVELGPGVDRLDLQVEDGRIRPG